MAKRNGYYSRKWLNKKEGHAFIEVESYSSDAGFEVTLGDCNKVITLDFYVRNKASDKEDSSVKGRLYKLDLIIS